MRTIILTMALCLYASSVFAIDFLSLIPEAKKQMAQDCLVANYKYQAMVKDPENPGELKQNDETAYEFSNRVVLRFWKENYWAYKGKAAAEEARVAAIAAAKAEF